MHSENIAVQELDNGLCLSVAGAKANAALAAFHRQMEAWGVTAPPVDPLVLDFGLREFERVGLIEYWIANEADAGYCGKYLFVFDGQQCPAHSHRVKHETFFPIRGCLAVTMGDRSLILPAGQVLTVPPGRVHSFQGRGNTLLLELSTPCEVSDNRLEDPRIGSWLERVACSPS
jgi:D-lyxose ketol-isomerase